MKFIQETQLEKELKYSRETTKEYLLSKLDEEDHQVFFDAAYSLIRDIDNCWADSNFFKYTTQDGTEKEAEYLKEVYTALHTLATVKISRMLKTLYCTVWEADGEPVSIQVLSGKLLPYFKDLSTTHRMFVAVQHILELFDSMDIVDRTSAKWDTVQFSLGQIDDISIMHSLNSRNSTLPLISKPRTVKDNSDCGYYHIVRPLLLGSNVSYHDEPLNYRHINRMNRIEFEYETRLFDLCEPQFKWKPKPKKKTGISGGR